MGWDAYASIDVDWNKGEVIHEGYRNVFLKWSQYVASVAGNVDGLFRLGGLDCSDCAAMLEKATGVSCWDQDGWDSEKVLSLWFNSNWDFEYDPELKWAYKSAEQFLLLCAAMGLSIRFDW